MANLIAPLLFPGFVSEELFARSILASLALLAVFGVLVAILLIDMRKRIVPNGLVVALLGLRLALLALFWDSALWGWEAFASSLVLVGIVLLTCLLTSAMTRKITGKESLGMGDVKLLSAAALFLTVDQLFLMLLLASAIGLVFALFFRFARHDPTFPFAPAICIGIIVSIMI